MIECYQTSEVEKVQQEKIAAHVEKNWYSYVFEQEPKYDFYTIFRDILYIN